MLFRGRKLRRFQTGGIVEKENRITQLPAKTQSIYNSIKDIPIKSIQVFRKPLNKVLQLLINIASGGIDSIEKKFGYDNLYHLGMVVELENGDKYLIEKNQNILIKKGGIPSGAETMSIRLEGRKITLEYLFDRAIVGLGPSDFYNYNLSSTNCQHFIKNVLSKSGLLNSASKTFIEQDISDIVENIPSRIKDTTKLITDIASVVDKLSQLVS